MLKNNYLQLGFFLNIIHNRQIVVNYFLLIVGRYGFVINQSQLISFIDYFQHIVVINCH